MGASAPPSSLDDVEVPAFDAGLTPALRRQAR